ncbi:hypothetical protein ANTQUA_LOCUS8923 [Anthophora quadrimaculata]
METRDQPSCAPKDPLLADAARAIMRQQNRQENRNNGPRIGWIVSRGKRSLTEETMGETKPNNIEPQSLDIYRRKKANRCTNLLVKKIFPEWYSEHRNLQMDGEDGDL